MFWGELTFDFEIVIYLGLAIAFSAACTAAWVLAFLLQGDPRTRGEDLVSDFCYLVLVLMWSVVALLYHYYGFGILKMALDIENGRLSESEFPERSALGYLLMGALLSIFFVRLSRTFIKDLWNLDRWAEFGDFIDWSVRRHTELALIQWVHLYYVFEHVLR